MSTKSAAEISRSQAERRVALPEAGKTPPNGMNKRVAGAAAAAFDPLEQGGRSGRDSPPLSGRADRKRKEHSIEVVEKPEERMAEQIASNQFTSELADWLEDLGWEQENLDELEELDGTPLFQLALCEQAADLESETILDLCFDKPVKSFQEELGVRQKIYEELLSLIPPAGEEEPNQDPALEQVNFIDPAERQRIRNEHFHQGDLSWNQKLIDWLRENQFGDYIEQLQAIQDAEILAFEIANLALKLEQYDMIQSLPRIRSGAVREAIRTASESADRQLLFVNGNLAKRESAEE